VTSKENRISEFLAKAEEAEKMAKACKDPQVRDSWQNIAQSYRDLANTTSFMGGKL